MPGTRTPHVTVAAGTLPGGSTNQDRYFVSDSFVFVLDGASSPDPQAIDGGTYADLLLRALSRQLFAGPDIGLSQALGHAIADVARGRSLQPGESPSSAVAILRWSDSHAEGLVLGDSPIIAQTTTGELDELRDNRLAGIAPEDRTAYQDSLRSGGGYGEAHRQRLRRLVAAQRAKRNQPDGYWIAEAQPEAAGHALRKRWRLSEVQAILIATDGVSCGIERLGVPSTWQDAFRIVTNHDVDTLLHLIRDAESTDPDGRRWPRSKVHDDKTAIVVTVHP